MFYNKDIFHPDRNVSCLLISVPQINISFIQRINTWVWRFVQQTHAENNIKTSQTLNTTELVTVSLWLKDKLENFNCQQISNVLNKSSCISYGVHFIGIHAICNQCDSKTNKWMATEPTQRPDTDSFYFDETWKGGLM